MQTREDLTARVASLEARALGSRRLLALVLLAAVVAWSLQGAAQDDWAPPGFHLFSPNTPAVASEVNDNFRWLVERVGDCMPVGSILAFAGDTAPAGWLLCDGDAIDAGQYPELAALLRGGWGSDGDTVALPDLRGRFLRGVDRDAVRDPDGRSRGVGSYQQHALQNIAGTLPEVATNTFAQSDLFRRAPDTGLVTNLHTIEAASGGDLITTFQFDVSNTDVNTSTETRPENAAVQFIIKY
jgi:microcystin-dependent protein